MDVYDEAGARAGDPSRNGWGSTLYGVVISEQDLVVRINGLDPDAPEGDYLSAVRPYGLLRMAWAIWREVPGVEPEVALSLARRVRRKGEAEVFVAAWGLGARPGDAPGPPSPLCAAGAGRLVDKSARARPPPR